MPYFRLSKPLRNRSTPTINRVRSSRRFLERWRKTKMQESRRVGIEYSSEGCEWLLQRDFRQLPLPSNARIGGQSLGCRYFYSIIQSCELHIHTGFDRTVGILRLCVLELINHPDVQRKLQKEIDDTIGDRVSFVDSVEINRDWPNRYFKRTVCRRVQIYLDNLLSFRESATRIRSCCRTCALICKRQA